MTRNAMMMAMTVGALSTLADAQVATLTNGGFETPSNLGGGSQPLGWQNPDPLDTRYRRVGDGLTPEILAVGTAGAITPHAGERLMEFLPPADATNFRGLSTDLRHICEESGVGAVIDASKLPVATAATLQMALDGGEDYELLFTAPESARVPKLISGVAVTEIGQILPRRRGRPRVALRTERGLEQLEPHGWEHFSRR